MIKRLANGELDITVLEIKDVIDINLLQTFQDNFSTSMTMASVTVDKEGTPVTKPSSYTDFCTDFTHSTKVGDDRCAVSHKKGGEEAARTLKPYIYTCHAGLVDFAAPISIGGHLIGTILGGQVLTSPPEESQIRKTATEIGVNEDSYIDEANKIVLTTKEKITAAAEVLYIVANSLSQSGYQKLKSSIMSQTLADDFSQISATNEDLQKLLSLQEEYIANISHEFKTPLNVILSATQLLDMFCANRLLDENRNLMVKHIDSIKKNTYRLSKLINNIVDLSKIEAGFFKLNLSNNNIVEVVENMVLSVAEFIENKGLNIIFDTEIEEKIIACDPEKLDKIVLNLLTNAIKFSNKGDKISVTITEKDEFVEVSVEDTGIGIRKEYLDTIFDKFNQVDKSLSRNAEGTGVGLSLVKSIAELAGGSINVESEFGKGSKFTVQLPSSKVLQENMQFDNTLRNWKGAIQVEFSDVY